MGVSNYVIMSLAFVYAVGSVHIDLCVCQQR